MDYAMAATSLAHTFGNVTSFVTEYVKSLFPKNYFKTVHISSTVAFRQFNRFQNTKLEYIKKNKPMLIIRPRIEINDSDTFLYGTFLTSRITDNYMDLDFSNLQSFIEDADKGIRMKYLLNRMKMYFDVTIIIETQMEQINQVNYFKNRVRQEHPFYLTTALESFVPKELMEIVSKDSGIPMYDANNNIKPFLDYLNSKSYYPVTYKIKNSSGKDEFFRYYPVHIDTTIAGLSADDGSKKGFVADAYTINFTVSTEFNTAGLYYYFTENPDIIQEVDMSIVSDDKRIVPIFTISNLFAVQPPNGWNLYTAPMYKVESDEGPDKMDIKSLFNHSLLDAIAYHQEKGIPLDNLIKIYVMKDNTMLDANLGEYSVDFNTMELITNKTNLLSTYRLIVHVNTLYINALISELNEFRNDN